MKLEGIIQSGDLNNLNQYLSNAIDHGIDREKDSAKDIGRKLVSNIGTMILSKLHRLEHAFYNEGEWITNDKVLKVLTQQIKDLASDVKTEGNAGAAAPIKLGAEEMRAVVTALNRSGAKKGPLKDVDEALIKLETAAQQAV